MPDDSELITFRIYNLEDHETKKGNDCVKIHGQPTSENGSFTLWMFKDDWIEDLRLREEDYVGEEFEVLITDKTNGTRNHVWAEYLWPTDEDLQDVWFDSYLKSRDINLDKPSEQEVKKILEEIEMSFDDDKDEDKNFENENVDRNVKIERQASMHFASRIVSARVQSGYLGEGIETEEGLDEKVEEELNKWMRKFQRGITTGKVQ